MERMTVERVAGQKWHIFWLEAVDGNRCLEFCSFCRILFEIKNRGTFR